MRARATTDGAQQRSGVSMAAKQASATATATKKVKVLTEPDLLKAPEKDYMNEAQLAFFRRRLIELRDQLLQNADDTGEHLRENEIDHRSVGPRDARRGVHARASHARPRAKAAEEGREVAQADRRRQLRLLRGDGRADRHSAPARASDGHALARGAGAPRAGAEALRGLTAGSRAAPAGGVAPRLPLRAGRPCALRGRRPPCG